MTTETLSESIQKFVKETELEGKTIATHLREGSGKYLNALMKVIADETREHQEFKESGKKWINFTLNDSSFLKVKGGTEDVEEKQEAKNANTIFFKMR